MQTELLGHVGVNKSFTSEEHDFCRFVTKIHSFCLIIMFWTEIATSFWTGVGKEKKRTVSRLWNGNRLKIIAPEGLFNTMTGVMKKKFKHSFLRGIRVNPDSGSVSIPLVIFVFLTAEGGLEFKTPSGVWLAYCTRHFTFHTIKKEKYNTNVLVSFRGIVFCVHKGREEKKWIGGGDM